jgi:diguanylate cyclase (GGDEF)-like protein
MTSNNLPSSSGHQPSRQPLIVKFFNWSRENRQATFELVGLAILAILTYFILHAFNLTEAFFTFTRKYESLQLDELTISVLIVIFYLSIFATRRWIESVQRLRQANTDSLTGLFNRRKGWEVLEFDIDMARRYHRPLSLIMFDLDHFKEINDLHGHVVGDRLLKLISRTVLDQIRATDILMRWGGEEFIIVSVETDQAEARLVAERLRVAIEGCSLQKTIHVTGSFGIAQLQENDTFDSFLRRVDDKVYEAKSLGRNTVA